MLYYNKNFNNDNYIPSILTFFIIILQQKTK